MLGSKFAAKFSAAQPRWSKWLLWFVGLPCWAAWGVAIVRATDDAPLPMWALGAFAVFFATGVIQWICYLDRKSD